MAPQADLTTTRINRLLRPLRVSCNHLAAHASTSGITQSASTGMITYSRANTWRPAEKGPLATVLPPETLLAGRPPSKGGVRNVELSRKLYAVRNAFRNLLQGALGSPSDLKGKGRMLSLREICAGVVGEGIQEEIVAQMGEGSDLSENAEDEEEMAITDEMYEYVPMQYRWHTLVSHALYLVLHTCPHDPTLLSSLLDITLNYRLVRESRIILDTLLAVAIPAPPSNSSSRVRSFQPLCHPAHTSYLTDLFAKWTSDNSSRYFSVKTFAHSLLAALELPGVLELWAGKAVRRLARELRRTDFAAFVQLASGLAQSLPPEPPHLCADDEANAKHTREARKRLAKWIYTMFDRLYGHGLLDSPAAPEQVEDYFVVINFLLEVAVAPSRLHVHSTHAIDDREEEDDMADTAVSLATFCLASPLSKCLPDASADALVTLLGAAVPRPTTFDSLILLIFPLRSPAGSVPSAEPTSPGTEATLGSPHHILRVLKAHARALKAHSLPRLEAALWAGALRTLDGGWLAPRAVRGRAAAAAALRDELVGRVEKAEKKAFGSGTEGMRWEEMVGAWVQCTPARPAGAVATPGPTRAVRATPRVTPKTPLVAESSDEGEDDDSGRGSTASLDEDGRCSSIGPGSGREPLDLWAMGEDEDEDEDEDMTTDGDRRRLAVEDTPIPARVLARAAIKQQSHPGVRPAAANATRLVETSTSLSQQMSSSRCTTPAVMPSQQPGPSRATVSAIAPLKALVPTTKATTASALLFDPTQRTRLANVQLERLKPKRLRPVLANRQLNGTPHPTKFIPSKLRPSPSPEPPAPVPISRSGPHYPVKRGVELSPVRKRARFARGEPDRKSGKSMFNNEDAGDDAPERMHGPSSDDALDLFGCPDSSPVKTRRA